MIRLAFVEQKVQVSLREYLTRMPSISSRQFSTFAGPNSLAWLLSLSGSRLSQMSPNLSLIVAGTAFTAALGVHATRGRLAAVSCCCGSFIPLKRRTVVGTSFATSL
jgi:hypothetical protein